MGKGSCLDCPIVFFTTSFNGLARSRKLPAFVIMISENHVFSLNSEQSAFLQVRLALGLSRKNFGAMLGVSEDAVGDWEKGKSPPSLNIAQIKQLNRILKQLGVDWEDLPDNVGDPKVPLKQYKRIKRRGLID